MTQTHTNRRDRPFVCSSCGRDYPDDGLPYRCPTCGGHFDLAKGVQYLPVEGQGFERFRASLPPGAPLYSLGEGNTPLVPEGILGRRVFLKCEHLNPTGSFKDRGTVVLVSALKAAGITEAVEDSSGNAGSSFAAYAARAGIHARVFVPDYASGPKRAQIEAYGAELVRVSGPRSETTKALMQVVEDGVAYASHAHMPHIIAGMATLAFELTEALGQAPGAVVLPIGQGTLLLGSYLGFRALKDAGKIEELPQLVGVQALACAPLWAVHTGGSARLDWVQEGETKAEGIRILRPLRGDAILEAVEQSGGTFVAVEEADIPLGQAELASRGFLVEPTSAVIWSALEQKLPVLRDPVVAVLTGSGFKSGPASWPQPDAVQAGSRAN